MKILRNVLAIVLGVVVGGAVNMALVLVGPAVIPPPGGVDVANPESLASAMHLYEPRHFLFPFLAHALGTLAGSLVAFLVAGSLNRMMAIVIGCVFLAGGVAASFMIPAPAWFIGVDLVLAYIPMALLGAFIGARFRPIES